MRKENIRVNRMIVLVVSLAIIITIAQMGLLLYEPLTNLIGRNEMQKTDSKIIEEKAPMEVGVTPMILQNIRL